MGGRVKIVWTLSFFVLLTGKSLSFLLEKLSLSLSENAVSARSCRKCFEDSCFKPAINTTPKTEIPAGCIIVGACLSKRIHTIRFQTCQKMLSYEELL